MIQVILMNGGTADHVGLIPYNLDRTFNVARMD